MTYLVVTEIPFRVRVPVTLGNQALGWGLRRFMSRSPLAARLSASAALGAATLSPGGQGSYDLFDDARWRHWPGPRCAWRGPGRVRALGRAEAEPSVQRATAEARCPAQRLVGLSRNGSEAR